MLSHHNKHGHDNQGTTAMDNTTSGTSGQGHSPIDKNPAEFNQTGNDNYNKGYAQTGNDNYGKGYDQTGNANYGARDNQSGNDNYGTGNDQYGNDNDNYDTAGDHNANHGNPGTHGHHTKMSGYTPVGPVRRSKLYKGLARSSNETTSYLDSLNAVIVNNEHKHKHKHKNTDVDTPTQDRLIKRTTDHANEMKRLSEAFRGKGSDVSDSDINEANHLVEDTMTTVRRLAEATRSYETSVDAQTHPSTGEKVKLKVDKVKEKVFGVEHVSQKSLVEMMHMARQNAWNGYQQLEDELNSVGATKPSMSERASRALHHPKHRGSGTAHGIKEKVKHPTGHKHTPKADPVGTQP